MFRLARSSGGRDAQIAFTEFAAEEIDGHAVAEMRELGIITIPFVAEKRVGTVELVPGEIRAGSGKRSVNFGPALGRDVWILPAPDHEQLAFDFADPLERVVV